MKTRLKHIIVWLLPLLGCVEPYEITDEVRSSVNIEDILVVEATLTDDLKQHTVFLRKGSSLTTDSLVMVQNATVNIVDNLGNIFAFVESEPSIYLSNDMFQATTGDEYQLRIETAGKTYSSDMIGLPPSGDITRIYAERLTNDFGVDGVGIFVDTSISQEKSPFLRYTYEETYKIIAPLWQPLDLVVLNPDPPFEFGLEAREQEERVCYGTQLSNEIIQNDGVDITGNTLEKVMVRFIPKDNYIISHRYSIKVNQLVQSADAFAFYKTLNDLSSSESVFTDVQSGFIGGNISNIEDSNEKVIGYFEVANQSEERLFFNYEDFFSEENERSYTINCNFLSAPETTTPAGTSPLKDIIESGDYVYVGLNGIFPAAGPYLVARRACGDCTVLGSNVIPEFWVE